MKLKHLTSVAVAFCALGLFVSSTHAIEIASSDYLDEEFFASVVELRETMINRKNEVCTYTMADFKTPSKFIVKSHYEDEYLPSFCIRMDNSIAALAVFIDTKWDASKHEGVHSNVEVEHTPQYKLAMYRRGHKEFSENAEKVLRIFHRNIKDVPHEWMDTEEEMEIFSELEGWAEDLAQDVELASAKYEELDLAWQKHNEEMKIRTASHAPLKW